MIDPNWDGSWFPTGVLTVDDPQFERFIDNCALANGCFDILHSGHLAVIEHLWRISHRRNVFPVIALNSDTSAAILKPGRPIVPQDERANLLTKLVWPLTVIIFDEQTPIDLMMKLRPVVVVKGGDYRPEDVVRWSSECDIEIVGLIPGISTTKMIEGTVDK